MCQLRAAHGLSGRTAGVVGGAVRTLADARGALPLPGLPWRVSAAAGFAGRGTGPHQRFLGPPAGIAGRGSPVSAGSRLAELLLGVAISPMGVWRVAQRLGQAAAS